MNPSITPSIKHISSLLVLIALAFPSQAKVWRLNNNAGISADFTTIYAALQSANVHDGDTLYLEPSATDYTTNGATLAKRLTFIGPGYFLDPANTTNPGNAGLQLATTSAGVQFLRLGAAAAGSKFMGVSFSAQIYGSGASNITFEKVWFTSTVYFETGVNDGFTFRKCFFTGVMNNSTGLAVTHLTIENCIFWGNTYVSLPNLSGTGNLFRNNSVYNSPYSNWDIENCYIANNIFSISQQMTLTNSTIKNNLFQISQTLPGTATGNLVSQNITAVYVGGSTGSLDSRIKLASGSPALGKGVTVNSYTPDCGAYGGPDPYILSGIPAIPSIYTLTVPTSIPTGTATMNITFSTKNNN